ncbi:MAG: hypothetical protein GX316_02715 [Firmicutes bacterium]|nr:hypothetical protein [Bacillota bacterium]
MSRIIKAGFEPIIDVGGTQRLEEQKLHKQFSKQEPTKSSREGASDAAVAIIDAAKVMSAAKERAAEILHQAESRAIELVLAAENETGIIQEKAHQKGVSLGQKAGYEEGYEDGFNVGYQESSLAVENQFQAAKEAVDSILGECRSIRSRSIAQAERDILVLSLAIAQKIAASHFEKAPEKTVGIIKEVVEGLKHSEGGIIKVHPSVAAVLNDVNTAEGSGVFDGFEFAGDSDIALGGCVVETAFGRLDARLETRFANLREALGKNLEEGKL